MYPTISKFVVVFKLCVPLFFNIIISEKYAFAFAFTQFQNITILNNYFLITKTCFFPLNIILKVHRAERGYVKTCYVIHEKSEGG